MPYIKPSKREYLDAAIKAGALFDTPLDAGEVAYLVYKLLLANRTELGSGAFARMAEMRGAIELAMDEFYRREVAPYEHTKMVQNGDVYL